MSLRPGEYYDCRGVPVYPGDLIRTLHFIGARHKKYYLYRVAVWNKSGAWPYPRATSRRNDKLSTAYVRSATS